MRPMGAKDEVYARPSVECRPYRLKEEDENLGLLWSLNMFAQQQLKKMISLFVGQV